MNTFRLRHQPGRVHIVYDPHGNPVIAVTLPNGTRLQPDRPLPQHWQHLNRLVRRAARKIKTTCH